LKSGRTKVQWRTFLGSRPVTYTSEEKSKVIKKQLENRFKTTQAIYEENKTEGSDLSYDITRRIINYNFITKKCPKKNCDFKGNFFLKMD